MPGVATIITRAVRAVLLSLLVSCRLACWPMSPILLLLSMHWGLLLRWSGPGPLLLMHGLDPLQVLLSPKGLPHSILVSNVINTHHVQLNISSESLDKASDSLRLWCDKGLGKSGELGETELILVDDHVTLNGVLKLSQLLVSDVNWDELPEEVCLEGSLSCLVSNHLVGALHGPPPVLRYATEHVCC